MVSRRKYKVRGYRDGGAVKPSVEASADVPPPPADALPPPAPDDTMQRIVAATRHAEELQRQARQAPPPTIESYVDSLPGLSDHKRAFLKAHPELLERDNARTAALQYQAALAEGIPDDTEEMNQRLLSAVRGEAQLRRQRDVASANAAIGVMTHLPQIDRRDDDQAADRLDREASAIRATMQAESATPVAMAENLPAPAPSPRGRSLPVAAPVSREVPSASGQRTADFRNITLSPAEREIARNSFSDPNMTDAQRERLYAKNKAIMLAMRANGTLNE